MIMKKNGIRRISPEELLKVFPQTEEFETMPTVECFLLKWLDQYIMTPRGSSTHHNFHSYITSHICPILGDYLISELDSRIIQYFVNKQLEEGRLDGKGGLSPKTVKEYVGLLRCALRKAVELNLIPFNPCLGIVIKKAEKEPVKTLSIEEQNDLADMDTTFAPNSNVTVLIGEYGGLRIGEVAALKVKDIDLEKGFIYVNKSFNRQAKLGENGFTFPLAYARTKNGKSRSVPMCKELKKALTNYLKTMPAEYKNDPECPLFLNRKGKAMEPRLINYHFTKLMKQHGIKNIHFHSLRHTFATRALEACMNIKTCAAILGHATTQITADLYIHITENQKLKEIEKLDLIYSRENG